jgi:NADP-dependent 3-hydroxy acid dehydrogenase YdfG
MATWLITGCSTGLGRALASTALDRGENVVVTARDAATVEDLARSHPGTALALSLDVMDHAQRRDVVRGALDRFGAIDVLVNNAGHGYRTAVEEAAVEQVQEFFVPRRREATQRGRRRLGADQPEHQLPRLKNETE